MNKGGWILASIVAGGTAIYFGFKWLESLAQNKVTSRENNDLQYKNNNAVQENAFLKQQNTAVAQENQELKNRISKLPAQPEPPPQTA